jgi:hypothetical protein
VAAMSPGVQGDQNRGHSAMALSTLAMYFLADFTLFPRSLPTCGAAALNAYRCRHTTTNHALGLATL